MADATYRMIHIGKMADWDVDEDSAGPRYDAERAFSTVRGQTYGSNTDPLYDHVVEVTLHDTSTNGIVLNNAPGAQERISYTLNGNNYSYEIDSTIRVRNVVLTQQYPDGSLHTVTTVARLFQDTSGNVFMMPPPVNGGESGEVASVTTYPIVSIQLPSSAGTNGSNYVTAFTAVDSVRYDLAQFLLCFCNGTAIATENGEKPVEDIRVGDMVMTRDNGLHPVRWIGMRRIDDVEMQADAKLRPFVIRTGALGKNMPSSDLYLSRQHRVLVRSHIAVKMFDTEELLVPAVALTGIPGIEEVASGPGVTYFHLMLENHEIVFANGAEAETLYPGPQVIESLSPAAAEEIFTIFPALRGSTDSVPAARPMVSGSRARGLARRHIRNAHPLVN
ncbi:Hint domain-containing protein [Paracoccus pacificus]|uniref:Hint domain-containing protein n=1 Tax=Paracoccus pacificus TaxID=1463598 RepID=A0ABW4RB84_9RHOB